MTRTDARRAAAKSGAKPTDTCEQSYVGPGHGEPHGPVPRSFRQKLMFAASAGMLSLAAPVTGLYGGRAAAQTALPTGCVDDVSLAPGLNNGDGNADPAETIECVSNPSGTYLDAVELTQANLTLNIGDGSTGTYLRDTGSSVAALNLTSDADITINVRRTAAVDGFNLDQAKHGIKAYTSAGSGSIQMTLDGQVYGNADKGAIYAISNSSGNIGLTVNTIVMGQVKGIYALNKQAGTTSITVGDLGRVNGQNDDGIYIKSTTAGASATVTGTGAGRVFGATSAIDQRLYNADILVENLDEVIGGSEAAIRLRSTGGTITVRNINTVASEQSWAVDVDTRNSDGQGGYAGGGNAISIQNLTIPKYDHDGDSSTPPTVSGAGIRAYSGTGSINIGADDPVGGSGIGDVYTIGTAIDAVSHGGAVDILVEGNIGSTSGAGLLVTNAGDAVATTITTHGTIDTDLYAMHITNAASAGAMTITATDEIKARQTAIKAENQGGGATTITTAGVRSDTGTGIDVLSGDNSTGLSVTVNGDMRAFKTGVRAAHDGSGGVQVDVMGDISTKIPTGYDRIGNTRYSRFANSVGIYAKNSAGDDGLNITLGGEIKEAKIGIDAKNYAGDLTITTLAQADAGPDGSSSITAQEDSHVGNVVDRIGIQAYGGEDSGAISISIGGQIVVGGTGIGITHKGTGDIDIESFDRIEGTTYGVNIDHQGTGSVLLDLAANFAINATNGTAAQITTAGLNDRIVINGNGGSVAGTGTGAILTTNGGTILVEDLDVLLGHFHGAAIAKSHGGTITLRNIGSVESYLSTAVKLDSGGGDITIENIALPQAYLFGLTKYNQAGIYAYSHGGTIDMGGTTDAAALGEIRAVERAIYANSGAGDINIHVHGPIESTQSDGVFAQSNGGDITIDTSDSITANHHGLYAQNLGALGTIKVTANTVNASTEDAIQIRSNSSEAVEITVTGTVATDASDKASIRIFGYQNNTVTVSATGDIRDGILFDQSSTASDTLILDGTLYGGARLWGGDDTFMLGNDAFDHVYGGTGTDTVNFTSLTGGILDGSGTASDKVQEFEIFNFNGDNFTLNGLHTGLSEVNFNAGTTILTGQINTVLAQIRAGATLNAADGSTLMGNLINSGRLTIGSSPGRFDLMGDFVQTADGSLLIEIFANGTWDQLFVTGTANLDGELDIWMDLANLPDTAGQYLFLTANGGLLNQFATITDNVPDVDFTVIYDQNTAAIDYVPAVTGDPDDPDDTGPGDTDPGDTDPGDTDPGDTDPGQGGDGSIDPGPEDPDIPLLSAKEIAPSGLAAAMRANDMFADTLIQRRALALASNEWSFWASAFGGRHEQGISRGILGWHGDTNGYGFGVERLVEKNGVPILFGGAIGYTESALTSEHSYARVEGHHVGAFANAEFNALFVAGALSYGVQDYDFERAILAPTGARIAFGETEGTSVTLKTEAFYDLLWSDGTYGDANAFGFGPVATYSSTMAGYASFTETNAGILNLNWTDEHAYQTVLGLGGAGTWQGEINGGRFDTALRLVWEKVAGDRAIETRAFLDVANAHFSPSAAPLDADRLAIGLDAKLYLGDGLYAGFRFDTTRAENLIDNEGWAGITIEF